MRMRSWRWDQIAEYRRKQGRVSQLATKAAEPVGRLALPLTLIGFAVLAVLVGSALT